MFQNMSCMSQCAHPAAGHWLEARISRPPGSQCHRGVADGQGGASNRVSGGSHGHTFAPAAAECRLEGAHEAARAAVAAAEGMAEGRLCTSIRVSSGSQGHTCGVIPHTNLLL